MDETIEISDNLANVLAAAGVKSLGDLMLRKHIEIEGMNDAEAHELAAALKAYGLKTAVILVDRMEAQTSRLKRALDLLGESFIVLGEALIGFTDKWADLNANEGGKTDGEEMVEGDGAGDGGLVPGDVRPGPEPGDPAGDK